jgi:hypothetical protein
MWHHLVPSVSASFSSLAHTHIFEKNNIFCVPYKKDKFVYERMTIYGTYFVVFFTDAI